MTGTAQTVIESDGFIARHGLWTEEQREAAVEVEARLADLDFVRLVFGDPHGLARSKTLTAASFRVALRGGMDYSPGPFIFDTGHALGIDIFEQGGGLGIPELTGAGDFILVPDPLTFRLMPHTRSRTGWVIGDEYLRSGAPHPLSCRAVLRRLVTGLRSRDQEFTVGLEVEWYLTRLAGDQGPAQVGGFGVQGGIPRVEPVNLGYQFNLDGYIDALEPVLQPVAEALLELDLPLRTFEHESGPGQLEFTFAPMEGLAAADAMLLFRTVTKQVCARRGHHASFMGLPGLAGFDASGWHLHQSLARRSSGQNLFAGDSTGTLLSELAMGYLGGLIEHAADAPLLCIATASGYRRLGDEFSLSPDRVGWAPENRGAFLRVLGGFGDPATHVENRIGEPCANPYLYLASQLAAGMDGVDRALVPPAAADHPHAPGAPRLPSNLADALAAFERSRFYRSVLGGPLFELLGRLKRSELRRYEDWLSRAASTAAAIGEWEQREYFAIY